MKNPSKDKEAVKKKPFIYECKRNFGIQNSNDKLSTFVMTPFQDGFVLLKPSSGGIDHLIDCRRKTEMVGTVLDLNSQVSVQFSESFNLGLKGGKSKEIKFVKDPNNGSASGNVKAGLLGFGGVTVSVTQGEDKNADPQIVQPKQIEKVSVPRNTRPQAQPKQQNNPPQPKSNPVSPPKSTSQPKPTPTKTSPKTSQPKTSPKNFPKTPVKKNTPPPKNKVPSKKQPPSKAPPKKGGPQKKCRVLYDFAPENEDEMQLSAGDIVIILDDSDSDWWRGTINGRTGLFPSSYSQMI